MGVLESSAVRVYDTSQQVVGAGFLIASSTILTCARVVESATERSPAQTAPEPQIVKVDFPFLDPGLLLRARVAFQDVEHDIAGLVLETTTPAKARSARLVQSDDFWNHPFRAYSFPEGREKGVSVHGIVQGRSEKGWLEVVIEGDTSQQIHPSLSGGPVWDEKLNGVIGLATVARMWFEKAFIIPADTLVRLWPELSESVDAYSPYRGLLRFRPEDAEFFFGRDDITKRLRVAVASEPFVALVGPSGSGKSSVVYAGLVPALNEAKDWLIADLRPGDQPFQALGLSLVELLEPDLGSADRLLKAGEFSRQLGATIALTTVVEAILRDHATATRLLVIIDQFEELFAQGCGRVNQQRFLLTLLAAIEKDAGNLAILVTMRADFMEEALSHRPLADALQARSIYLGPMNEEELTQAVEKPAEMLGVRFEPGLASRILEDAGREPGSLPLLEFALTKLWEQREHSKLTHDAYNRIGEVSGALARHADEVMQTLDESEKQRARYLFLQMVQTSEDHGKDTRRLAYRSGFSEDEWATARELASSRLLVIGQSGTGGTSVSVELAHEALIREWQQLRRWIREERQALTLQSRLSQLTDSWLESGRDGSYLLRGKALQACVQVFGRQLPADLEVRRPSLPQSLLRAVQRGQRPQHMRSAEVADAAVRLSDLEKAFLAASMRNRKIEERAKTQRKVGFAATFLLLVTVVFILVRTDWYVGKWELLEGVYGGNITAVAPDPWLPGTAYAAVFAVEGSQLYRTADGGNTWDELGQGVPRTRIEAVLIADELSQELLLGTVGSGVLRSMDGGSTWQAENDGLTNFVIYDLKLGQPPNNGSLFAASEGRDGGILRSSADQIGWQRTSQGLPGNGAYQVLVPTSDRAYALARESGAYRSIDGAQSWERTPLAGADVQILASMPGAPATVFAGVADQGIFKSTDGGLSWLAVNNGLPDFIAGFEELEISHVDPDTAFAMIASSGGTRFFRTGDGGQHWEEIRDGWLGASVNQMAQRYDEPDRYLIGTRAGLYEYDDRSEELNRIEAAFDHVAPSGLVVHQETGTIYATFYGGVYRSADRGQNWQLITDGISNPTVRTLAVDYATPGRLLLGTYSDGAPQVVFVSKDDGNTWQPLGGFDNGIFDDDVRAIVVDSTSPGKLYAATFGSGVFKSEDDGETWHPVNAGLTRKEIVRLAANPNDSEDMVAIAIGGSVFRTVNGAETWEVLAETMNIDVRDVAFSADGSQICMVIYGRLRDNVLCSNSTPGEIWVPTGEGITSRFPTLILAGPVGSSTLYIGTLDRGVIASWKGGSSWEAVGDELTAGEVLAMVTDPLLPDRVYVSIADQGLFVYHRLHRLVELLPWEGEQ